LNKAPITLKTLILRVMWAVSIFILLFLMLTGYAYYSVITFIQNDQKIEMSQARLYERLINSWIEISVLVTEDYLQGKSSVLAQNAPKLKELDLISNSLDIATFDQPRQRNWLQIKQILGSYTVDLIFFQDLLYQWHQGAKPAQLAQLNFEKGLASEVVNLRQILDRTQMHLKSGNCFPEGSKTIISNQSLIKQEDLLKGLETLGKSFENYRSRILPEHASELNQSVLSEMAEKIELRLDAFHGISQKLHDIPEKARHPGVFRVSTPSLGDIPEKARHPGVFRVSTPSLGDIPEKARHPGVFRVSTPSLGDMATQSAQADADKTFEANISAMQSGFGKLRKLSENRSMERVNLEESINTVHNELKMLRESGITLCGIEAEALWQGIDSDTEQLLKQIHETHLLRMIILGISFFIAIGGLLFLIRMITVPLDRLRNRFSHLLPGISVEPIPPSGLVEVDELENSFLAMAKRVNDGIRLHGGYISSLAQMWKAISSLHNGSAKSESPSGEGLKAGMHQLLVLLGNQLPALAMVKVMTRNNGYLKEACPPFVSLKFMNTGRFTKYKESVTDNSPIPIDNSVSGWTMKQTLLDPAKIKPGYTESFKDFSLVKWPTDKAFPDYERGLEGVFAGLRLRHSEGWKGKRDDDGLLFIYFDDEKTSLHETDWMFLTIISHQLISIVETAELLDISKKEREMSKQLQIAQEIQTSTLPPAPPTIKGLQIDALIRMANEVGGDHYDFFPMPDGRLGVLVADVSGKNVPAALLTMVLKTALNSLPVKTLSPGVLLREVNRVLLHMISETNFITAAYAVIDPANGTIRYANAGQNPPLFRRAGPDQPKIQLVEMPSFPLGIIECEFREEVFTANPGDILLMYSDGVIDCKNEAGNRFEEGNLRKALLEITVPHPARGILKMLDDFRGNCEVEDDITIVAISFQNRIS